jgi:hypothetical protein
VASKDISATEEIGSTPISGAGPETAKEQPRAFLDSGRRNLSEEEIASPAARRFLIFEIERLDAQCVELREVERRHSDLRVELATLKEGAKQSRLNELVSFICLTVGSAGLGAAPSYISVESVAGVGWVFAIGSGLLVVAGIASRIFR